MEIKKFLLRPFPRTQLMLWEALLLFALFLFVLFKALRLDITYDEAWTLFAVADKSFSDLVFYRGMGSNSHLFTSLVAKLAVSSGFPPELFLSRLPSVLAFPFYGWFVVRIGHSLTGIPLRLALYLLLFNPFLIDFFSLARGYALSLCFMAGSLVLLLRSLQRQGQFIHSALVMAALSVLANFTWLNYYVALLTVTGLVILLRHRNNPWRHLIPAGIISLMLLALVALPIHTLRQKGEFYFGGQSGLVYDTFLSLMQGLSAFRYQDAVLYPVFYLLSASLPVLLITRLRNKPRQANLLSPGLAFLFLTSLMVLLVWTQNRLLDTPFPVERTALVLFPPLVLSVVLLCSEALHKLLRQALTWIWMLPAAWAFQTGLTPNYSLSWPGDAHSRQLLETLNLLGQEKQQVQVLDYSWYISLGLRYYQERLDFPWVCLRPDCPQPDSVTAGYFLYFQDIKDYMGYNWHNEPKPVAYPDTLLSFPDEKLFLLGRKDKYP